MAKDKCKQFVFRMPDKQKEILKRLADRDDRSISATIRRAIDEYIEKRGGVFDNVSEEY